MIWHNPGIIFIPPVGHGDVTVTLNSLAEEIETVIFVEVELRVAQVGVELGTIEGFANYVLRS